MADKTKIISKRISYKGDFEITKIYRFAKDWLEGRGYSVLEERNIFEPLTKTNITRVEWDATRRVTDYYKFKLGVVFLVDPSEVSKKDGEKIMKGSFGFKVSGTIVSDYRKDYSKASAFRIFWRAVYDRFVTEDSREKIEEKLRGDVEELIFQIRSFLGMEI